MSDDELAELERADLAAPRVEIEPFGLLVTCDGKTIRATWTAANGNSRTLDHEQTLAILEALSCAYAPAGT
jgi:hypothetical protein